MKNTFNYILIIFLFFASCSNKEQITEFEAVLGNDKSETLTELINDFENEFLKTYYSDLNTEDAYMSFLYDVKNTDFEYWKKIDNKLKRRFKENQLEYDVYQIPDSVWVEKQPELANYGSIDKFIVRRKYLDSNRKINYAVSSGTIMSSGLIKDSILSKTRTFSLINLEGDYSKALEAISENSAFLTEYVDRRRGAGKFNPSILINLMSDYDVDLTDYFIKRIIVVDIVF